MLNSVSGMAFPKIEPLFLAGFRKHGAFAADVKGGDGQFEIFFQQVNHIKVIHRRFYHQKIRPFNHIQFSFYEGLTFVGWFHLVGLFTLWNVSRFPWGAIEVIPEWAVKSAGIFGCVRHNARIGEPALVERLPDVANPSVHHIARAEYVKASPGLGNGLMAVAAVR